MGAEMSLEDPFGEVIHTYTAADGLRDGVLVRVPEKEQREVGIRIPILLTSATWADCVTWTGDDRKRKPNACQDEAGRLWDVVWMASLRMRAAERAGQVEVGEPMTFQMIRVPRPGCGARRKITLKIVPCVDPALGQHVTISRAA